MPITLDDDLALLLVRQLAMFSASAPSIFSLVQENQKLLQQLNAKVDQLMSQTQTTDQQFQAEMATVVSDMTKQTTVTNSVLTFIQGMSAQLQAAITAAQNAGATADELAALTTLDSQLNANTSQLSAAITANTTAQSEAPAPVVPTDTGAAAGASGTDTTSGAAGVTGGNTGSATIS